ncbi:glycosyltransferase family 61 protein [Asticcacaulis taihuensis]|uniref:glycosyltransferase family 61 protein n=1 Tax=Asticcacaulis taihuensis TaxID=260084 RepID=UPI003F7CAD7C
MQYVIAHLDELYSKGGFYDSSISIEDLRQLQNVQGAAIKRLAQVFPGGAYPRITPRVHSQDEAFAATLDHIFTVVCRDYPYYAASLALEIDACSLYDNVIYVDAGNGLTPFYPTYRPNDRPYVRTLTADITPRSNLETAGRRLLYLGSAGSFNYGHWLVDDMPRLKWLLDDPRPTTVVMPSYPGMDKIRADGVKYLTGHLDIQVVFIPPTEIVSCQNLTYVTPVSFHPYIKNASGMQYLRSAVRPGLRRVRKMKERVYIRRRPERGRYLANSQAVESLLKRKGFVIVDPEDYSFSDQAAIFAQAEMVIGTMCAAMCNSIFSAAGTKLVYLSPVEWMEPFYWDLASTLGHTYTAIHGTRSMVNPAAHLDDFSIDIETLKNILNDYLT